MTEPDFLESDRLPNGRSTSKKKIVALAVLGLFVLLLFYSGWVYFSLPDVSLLTRENPKETALMRERGGKKAQFWVPLDRVSGSLIDAVIMGEDGGFFGHSGFDLYEVRQAFERNWEEGRTVRGASTITQQLAKNLFLESDRTYGRKLKEAILTYRLEKALSKQRILELYLNVIEWGDGVYGVEAAAQGVLGKSAAGLDTAEGALLAAMIPNPRRLNPCERPKSVRTRQERILRWMNRGGKIPDDEYQSALEERIWLRKCASFPPEG